MAKQRYINTKFWSDNFISDLNPLDRYLFLYFLTNEHTNIAGTYEIPLKTISFETGLEIDMLKKMLKRLQGKIYYIDGWVYIKNFAKHQAVNESITKGIDVEMAKIPQSILSEINNINELSPDETGNFLRKSNRLDVVPSGLRKKILERDGYSCQNCKLAFSANLLEIDHIKERWDGGDHNENNLQVLCIKCHREKSLKTPPNTLSQDPTYLNTNYNSNTNNNTEQSSEEIPLLIKSFEKINPACKKMYSNTTQRKACQDLIDEYGFDRVSSVIEKTLPKTNIIEFFPVITTPAKLRDKWADLESAIMKQKNKVKTNIIFS